MTSAETFRAAMALAEAALSEGRVERALSESRIAKLKAASELEHAGRSDEANALLEEIERERAR